MATCSFGWRHRTSSIYANSACSAFDHGWCTWVNLFVSICTLYVFFSNFFYFDERTCMSAPRIEMTRRPISKFAIWVVCITLFCCKVFASARSI